jgi:uncharacterized membrane protein YgdD (TMEM256/DUF423 family)
MTLTRFAAGSYVFAGLSALVSVALAALTSHGLANLAPAGDQAVEWFKIATSFQMNHAIGMIAVTAISDKLVARRPRILMRAAVVLLAAGSFLFPAALYSLSFAGPVFFAPYGGFAAMAGWALFAVAAVMALKSKTYEMKVAEHF